MNCLPSSRSFIFFIVFLLQSACATHKSSASISVLPQPYLAQPNEGVIYNAALRYKDFNASGLLVIKRVAASTYHVALISKFGPSLMELKLYEDSINWIKTFEQLNKKSVKNLIEKDFRLLLLTELDHPVKVVPIKKNDVQQTFRLRGVMKSRVTMETETKHVLTTENRQLFNPVKTKVSFRYDQQEIPSEISLEHTHVDMSLDLKLLKVKHAEK